MIGLLSDSHGDLDALARIVWALRRRDVAEIIHLGDFCDSLREEGLEETTRYLLAEGISAVKGNNDFLAENRLSALSKPTEAQRESLAFLSRVPRTIERGDACFAHSQPGNGFRSFFEPVEDGMAERTTALFAGMSCRFLFCGHSHHPVLLRWDGRGTTREIPQEETPVRLATSVRCIVIVGAADNGDCGLYDEKEMTYTRINIFP